MWSPRSLQQRRGQFSSKGGTDRTGSSNHQCMTENSRNLGTRLRSSFRVYSSPVVSLDASPGCASRQQFRARSHAVKLAGDQGNACALSIIVARVRRDAESVLASRLRRRYRAHHRGPQAALSNQFMRNILLAVTAIALGAIPCNGKPPAPARDQKTAAKPVTAENYLDQFVDRSISPRDHFFQFACGKGHTDAP